MIQLKIQGRTGNQFFQHAFVSNYIIENNLDEIIYVSFENLKKQKCSDESFKNELTNFKINNIKEINKVKIQGNQRIYDFIYKVINKLIRLNAKIKKRKLTQKDYDFLIKFLQKKLNTNGLYYYIPGMKELYKSKTNNIIFFGYYEENRYYTKNKEVNFKNYTPVKKEKKENESLYNIIKGKNSVCITIRRGDFLNPRFIKNHYICTTEYFEKAIEKMNTLIQEPQYIVFSDDIDWCKKNMKFPPNTKFESGKDPIWEKIRLMYSCKHFIISNSTFSWWAQYLSRNENKIVIAPKEWNKFEYADLIYDKDWILI